MSATVCLYVIMLMFLFLLERKTKTTKQKPKKKTRKGKKKWYSCYLSLLIIVENKANTQKQVKRNLLPVLLLLAQS